MRLPRLIGFRRAVEMVVTGQSIDGKTALKLGVVDQLFTDTQTVLKSALHGDGSTVYEYQWLSSLLSCLGRGEIGGKVFVIAPRSDTAAVSAAVDVVELSARVSQETMLSAVAENREKSRVEVPKEEWLFPLLSRLSSSWLLLLCNFPSSVEEGWFQDGGTVCLSACYVEMPVCWHVAGSHGSQCTWDGRFDS